MTAAAVSAVKDKQTKRNSDTSVGVESDAAALVSLPDVPTKTIPTPFLHYSNTIPTPFPHHSNTIASNSSTILKQF
jgi:hypothetical protein